MKKIWRDDLFLRKRSRHGTDKKSTHALVGGVFRIDRRPLPRHLHTLGMADADPTLPNHCIRQGNGHHVNNKGIDQVKMLDQLIGPITGVRAGCGIGVTGQIRCSEMTTTIHRPHTDIKKAPKLGLF